MSDRHFGAISDVPVGTTFADRVGLSRAKVHRPIQPGICGSNDGEGAESIVLSGGYGDDQFHGDTVIYTGQGGRNPQTKRQVADQPWNGYNASLARSTLTGWPVRVARLSSGFRDREYRYEGLYRVISYWKERGQDGFFVWQYRLERLLRDEAAAWGETWRGEGKGSAVGEPKLPLWLLASLPYDRIASVVEGISSPGLPASAAEETGPAPRRQETQNRIVRDTRAMASVKQAHDFTCQLCALRLDTPGGPYAEAAHVQPLGAPHDGPDVPGNLLCLCPNCHVRFDRGAVTIADDGRLIGDEGTLRSVNGHPVDLERLAYHRAHVYNPWPRGSDRT